MIIDSISFRGHRCFKSDWAGFGSVAPVNVIIGRNNTGKSHLLDLVAALCEGKFANRGWRYRCSGTLDEISLRGAFNESTSEGELRGNHWREHGCRLAGATLAWEIDEQGNPQDVSFLNNFDYRSPYGERSTQARLAALGGILKQVRHKLTGKMFRRLLAERDIRWEPQGNEMELSANGSGATNIIRRYITTSNPRFPRETIQRNLLAGLNEIFGSDGQFTEIQVKQHDELTPGVPQGHWEVFLGEEKKGLIALSNSGSGLKTVLLVLLNLLVVPEIQGRPKSDFAFAFEELENNLHPALLRRLLQFVEGYAVREKATVFLTTHSSAALDLFGISANAQIVHVTHDGVAARAEPVSAHFDHLGVVSELGAKPSDLLQANGIVWIEGPSDRIYINRWIELFSDGELREGRDYQCAFYGGSLLARSQFTSPEAAQAELANLLRVNSNIAVVCDSDRTAASGAGSILKERVQRIAAEVEKVPNGHIWITAAKEIENYLLGSVLCQIFEIQNVPDPKQYERFFPEAGRKNSSFVEKHLKRKSLDKVELAVQAAPYLTKELLATRFELAEEIRQIIDRIRSWNA